MEHEPNGNYDGERSRGDFWTEDGDACILKEFVDQYRTHCATKGLVAKFSGFTRRKRRVSKKHDNLTGLGPGALVEAVGRHGCNWQMIAKHLGHGKNLCRRKWVATFGGPRGDWTDMEMWHLKQGILEATGRLLPVTIPWPQIQPWLPNRSLNSIKETWYTRVRPQLLLSTDSIGVAADVELFFRLLVRGVMNSSVDHVDDLDWEHVRPCFTSNVNKRDWKLLLGRLPFELQTGGILRDQVEWLFKSLDCEAYLRLDDRFLKYASVAEDGGVLKTSASPFG